MDEFDYLRERAARKRDTAIQAAKDDYDQAVARINQLMRQLGGKTRKAAREVVKPIKELLLKVLPKNRTFTVEEAHRLLQEVEPARYFHVPSLRGALSELRIRGIARKITRGPGGHFQWCLADYKAPPNPLGLMSLPEACQSTLRERGPMRAIDITVHLQSLGYRCEADARDLVSGIISALNRHPDKFEKQKDRRWKVIDA